MNESKAGKESALSKATKAKEGMDYEPASGELVCGPGECEKAVKVAVIDDKIERVRDRARRLQGRHQLRTRGEERRQGGVPTICHPHQPTRSSSSTE